MIAIRSYSPSADSRTWMEIHHSAVRAFASNTYSEAILNQWAGPIDEEAIEKMEENTENELRLIAEVDGLPVGIGGLVVSNSKLTACYVAPQGARQGVGKALVAELERMAREHLLKELHMDASINAEAFYKSCGYSVDEYGEYIMRSGEKMACVKMSKAL